MVCFTVEPQEFWPEFPETKVQISAKSPAERRNHFPYLLTWFAAYTQSFYKHFLLCLQRQRTIVFQRTGVSPAAGGWGIALVVSGLPGHPD